VRAFYRVVQFPETNQCFKFFPTFLALIFIHWHVLSPPLAIVCFIISINTVRFPLLPGSSGSGFLCFYNAEIIHPVEVYVRISTTEEDLFPLLLREGKKTMEAMSKEASQSNQ